MNINKTIASGFGIGFVRGGGTIAAMLFATVWYLAAEILNSSFILQMIVCVFIFCVGVFTANKVEKDWGKDSSKVVIDEVAGMAISLLFIPITIKYVIAGLILFRIFDIAKPFLIRKMELMKSGWGVMMDDVLAGVYSNILLQLWIWYTNV